MNWRRPLLTKNSFSKQIPKSFLSLDTEGRVLRIDSFSKILGGGIRLGYVTADKHFIDKIESLTSAIMDHATALPQVSCKQNTIFFLFVLYRFLSFHETIFSWLVRRWSLANCCTVWDTKVLCNWPNVLPKDIIKTAMWCCKQLPNICQVSLWSRFIGILQMKVGIYYIFSVPFWQVLKLIILIFVWIKEVNDDFFFF